MYIFYAYVDTEFQIKKKHETSNQKETWNKLIWIHLSVGLFTFYFYNIHFPSLKKFWFLPEVLKMIQWLIELNIS